MSEFSLLVPWMRLAVAVALELAIVFTVAWLVARRLRPATQQRTVWRLAFLVAGALWFAEFLGFGHETIQSLRASRDRALASRVATVQVSIGPAPVAAPNPAPPAVGAATPAALSPSATSWSDGWLLFVPLAGLLWLALRRLMAATSFVCFGRGRLLESGDLPARTRALACRLGIRRRIIRLKIIPRLSSPIAFGVVRPVIGIPAGFATSHPEPQQDVMLAHELVHVAAFDAVWVFVSDLVTALVWWHPLAWWARRELRAASEAAADEASLLVEDGPATLAECLVALGARLTRTPGFGGLGMAESRFRSSLGRRVERLLELRGPEGRPWRGPGAWLARAFGLVGLAGLALCVAAWWVPPAASAATLAESFQRSPLGLATIAWLGAGADENDPPRPIHKGRELNKAVRAQETEAKRQATQQPKIGSTNTVSGEETAALHTRSFRVDLNRLRLNLDLEPAKSDSFAPWTEVVSNLVTRFARGGVELLPPQSIHFDDRNGLLLVRATLPELEVIEQTIATLNHLHQVTIEVKFCELADEPALGFDFLLGSVPTNSAKSNSPASSQVGRRSPAAPGATEGVTGVLTPQQYALVLRALEQKEGASLLAAPSILMPSGRQGQIKVVDVRTIVTGLDLAALVPAEPGGPLIHPPLTEQFELGPTVDLVPYVAADGYAIRLTAIPSIEEFIGYDTYTPPAKKLSAQPYPLPIFRLRQIVATATVWDGQTLVLFTRRSTAVVPKGHPANRLPPDRFDRITSEFMRAKAAPNKALLVFVTPRIVDAAGNSVHTEQELSARHSSVPPPPAPR